MNITVSEDILAKIRKRKGGTALVSTLLDLAGRSNTEYHRGVLHGYLLCLTTTGVITGDDAMCILEQIVR